MDTYLGLDFGGTKLAIGEMSASGEVLSSRCYQTGVASRQEAAELMLASLKDYRQSVGFQGRLCGAGAGVVGLVDHQQGAWISLDHEAFGAPTPLAEQLSDLLGVPSAVDNDVRSATTAELLFGCGRETDHFIYVNVGTGLAAGMVIDGRILRGAHNNSGEVGHTCCDPEDTLCACGRRGCAENAVSGVGFTRQYHILRADYPDSGLRLDENGRISAQSLFALADAGDALAVRIADHGAQVLANLVMNLVRVSDPQVVALGGGIVADGWLLEKMKSKLVPSCMRLVQGGIVLSRLNPHQVGLIGAASLGMCAATGRQV